MRHPRKVLLLTMCIGVAVIESELPIELVERHRLNALRFPRGTIPEFRFLWRSREALLPVWHEGNLKILQWGNRSRRCPLPITGWTWKASIEEGKWASYEPEPVMIPCTYGLEGSVWFSVEQGIRGLLVPRPKEPPIVYMVCDEATRYYQVMTRSERMPVLVDQVI